MIILAPKIVSPPSSTAFNIELQENYVVECVGTNPPKFEVCAVIRHQGEYLCLQRRKDPRAYFSRKFEFPTAHQKCCETPQEALIRAVEQKLGLDIQVRAYFHTAHYQANQQPYTKDVFLCESTHRTLKRTAHLQTLWLLREALDALDWTDADRTILSLITPDFNPTDLPVVQNVYFHY
jgi:ADP-ribose pyrophosphatase YjhB (NUDIX family)